VEYVEPVRRLVDLSIQRRPRIVAMKIEPVENRPSPRTAHDRQRE
jgi:hypothetical protein